MEHLALANLVGGILRAVSEDTKTAAAFASSWNNLPGGSVYTPEQFEDWLAPLSRGDITGKSVLEMGCGNGSLLVHMARWNPESLEGVDLGDSVLSARQNLSSCEFRRWVVTQADLSTYRGPPRDVVYCIGVLHHLSDPRSGFESVIANVKPGGRFHCWVYAREGNGLVMALVEPIRKVACSLPWWVTKYFVATPLSLPYFVYAKALRAMRRVRLLSRLPLYEYSLWIAAREFSFFRHVAFDQLVTPRTVFLPRREIESWLAANQRIVRDSTYIILRNGNSWKFGGEVR